MKTVLFLLAGTLLAQEHPLEQDVQEIAARAKAMAQDAIAQARNQGFDLESKAFVLQAQLMANDALLQLGLLAQDPVPAPMPSVRGPNDGNIRTRINIATERAKALTFAFGGSDDGLYRAAGRELDERQYEKAVETYNRVIETKSSHIEGALYWRAYALNRLGRADQAAASIDELKKGYPQSRWLNDARALELEIRQNAGQKASPEAESDEDLKLLAINGLIGTDPERVMPQIDKILNSAKSSPKLKERALFVLAQTSNAKARETLVKYAKGGSNPDLQSKAVEYLAAHGAKENRAVLEEIYQSNSDLGVRRAILRGYLASREMEPLMQVARNESNVKLRAEAVRYAAAAGGDVWPLYSPTAPVEVRQAVLEGLMMKGDSARLAEVARSDKDPQMRASAVRHLGARPKDKSGDLLVSLYASETDKGAKEEIQHALFAQGNAKGLIDVARKESDPSLKRSAVRQLTMMKSPEAQEFLVELLNK